MPKTLGSIWLRPQTRIAKLVLVLLRLLIRATPIVPPHHWETFDPSTKASMRNMFSLDQPAVCISAAFHPYLDQPGPMSREQRLRLATYCEELIPYAEVLCGDCEGVDTAMTHAFGEAIKKLWSLTTPLSLRVGFKRILIDSCFGVRGQVESLDQSGSQYCRSNAK